MLLLRDCIMISSHRFWVWLAFVWVGCSGDRKGVDSSPTDDSGSSDAGRVYITLVGHVEDHEMLTECPKWNETRNGLLMWAETIAPYTDTFNLQIDYPFLVTLPECETEAQREETGGENVLEYLQNAYGWEFDAHQEGGYEAPDASPDDYADVHWALRQVVSEPTDSVGGFVWNSQAMLDRLDEGYTDSRLHGQSWTPDVLTMAVHEGHHSGNFSQDDNTSGVWHPRDATEDGFVQHDADARLPYIGTGLQHSNWSGSASCDFNHGVEYAEVLLAMVDRGAIPATGMYTTSVAFPSSVMLKPDRYDQGVEILAAALALAESGRAEIASYRTVFDVWRSEYESEPTIVTYDQIDSSDYTCD